MVTWVNIWDKWQLIYTQSWMMTSHDGAMGVCGPDEGPLAGERLWDCLIQAYEPETSFDKFGSLTEDAPMALLKRLYGIVC